MKAVETKFVWKNAPSEEISRLKKRLGDTVSVLGHHYQMDEVVTHCDRRGDSLELARMIPTIDATHIVFCGVSFMGESAAILTRPGQSVYLPEDDAECVMALMSPAALVEKVLLRLTASGRKLIPMAYVNTSVAVKAVVGRYGGAVCTSANARKMLEWALNQGDGVFFLPDKNLARNTAVTLGLSPSEWHIADVSRRGEAVDLQAAARARLVIWPGQCSIHARFRVRHVEAARKASPGCIVVVHPECSPEVVNASDKSGSTTTIINVVREAKPGTTVYVGTEAHLVQRLAAEAAPRGVTVRPLFFSVCTHMAKVTPEKLCATLAGVAEGTATPVRVPEEEAEPARLALQRMLNVMR